MICLHVTEITGYEQPGYMTSTSTTGPGWLWVDAWTKLRVDITRSPQDRWKGDIKLI